MDTALGPTAVQSGAEHLLGRLEELVDRITSQVWSAVGYHDMLAERQNLEQQVRPNVLDALEYMRTGRDISEADQARLDELGRRRALQGIPMAAMVQSFRTAERVLIDAFCVYCIRSSVNSAEQRTGIQAISAILDKVERVTFNSYLETQRQLQQEHTNSVAVLLARLVDGGAGDRNDIDAQARIIGANPSLPYRCVALTVLPDLEQTPAPAPTAFADPGQRLTRLRRHLVARLVEARMPGPIVGVRDDALVLLVPSERPDSLGPIRRALDATQYRSPVIGGAGDRYGSLFDARDSCRQALAALDVATRQRRQREVVMYDDVATEVMLLGNRDASQRLISGYLAPLDDSPHLDETLRAYIQMSQSAQATASRLVVHVNTIAYRLRRVVELTGHDIRDPRDAVNFSLALRARDLLNATPAASA